MAKKQRTEEDYYNESRRLRAETMLMADSLRDNPLRFTVTNGITMDVEVTKSDLKTIVSKNTQDNRFNAFKNKVAQDIRGFIEKANYEGWREVIPGKHPETAYFAYLVESWEPRHISVFVKSRIQDSSSHMPLLTKRCSMLRYKICENKKPLN